MEFVNWFKDKAPFEPPYKSTDLANGSLILESVDYSDSGEYACMPYNVLGNSGGISEPFLLIVD